MERRAERGSHPSFSGAPDLTDLTVPDAITPVLGYRLWEIRHDALRSLWCGALPWAPRQRATAACHQPQGLLASRLAGRDLPLHAAPDPRCSCGIYAVSAPEDLPTSWSGTRDMVVWGTVALWGRVVVAERGWRGQFAGPVSLTYEPRPEWRGEINVSNPEWRRFTIAKVARRYQLPVLKTGREAWTRGEELLGHSLILTDGHPSPEAPDDGWGHGAA